MKSAFGERKIALCRELTKVHEEVIRTTIGGAIDYYLANEPKGEYVLVVGGADNSGGEEITLEQAVEQVKRLIEMGERPVDACKAVAKETPYRKGELYSAVCG